MSKSEKIENKDQKVEKSVKKTIKVVIRKKRN